MKYQRILQQFGFLVKAIMTRSFRNPLPTISNLINSSHLLLATFILMIEVVRGAQPVLSSVSSGLPVMPSPTDKAGEVYGGEFCHAEMFRGSCPGRDQVILILSALYGRMNLGRCVQQDLGHLGCQTDVLLMADRRCSGRRTCQIRVPDAEFETTRPCLKELKTYLHITYTCVTVALVTDDICKENDEFLVRKPHPFPSQNNLSLENLNSILSIQNPPESGFIASIMTSDNPSCDGSRQPWIVSVNPGQHIRLTLYDFSLVTGDSSATDSSQSEGGIRKSDLNSIENLNKQRRRKISDSGGRKDEQMQNNPEISGTSINLSPRRINQTSSVNFAETESKSSLPYLKNNNDREHTVELQTCLDYGKIEDIGVPLPYKSTSNWNSPKSDSVSSRKYSVSENYGVSSSRGRTHWNEGRGSQGGGRVVILCGGKERVKEVYTSSGNTVKIWITAGMGPRDMQRILLSYQVMGCPDLPSDADLVYRRLRENESLAAVRCRHRTDVTEEQLRCVNNTWRGTMPNCTGKPSTSLLGVAQGREAGGEEELWDSGEGLPVQFLSLVLVILIASVSIIIVIIVVAIARHRDRMRSPHSTPTAKAPTSRPLRDQACTDLLYLDPPRAASFIPATLDRSLFIDPGGESYACAEGVDYESSGASGAHPCNDQYTSFVESQEDELSPRASRNTPGGTLERTGGSDPCYQNSKVFPREGLRYVHKEAFA